MRTALVAGLAVALGCAVAGLVVTRRQNPPADASQSPQVTQEPGHDLMRLAARPATAPAPHAPSILEESRPNSRAPATGSAELDTLVVADMPKGVAQAPPAQEPMQDPVARFALQFVGVDPDAGQYWLEAINNPSLSAHERQDLIEDLNEDGFPDPENPTLADLPLILNRITIIQGLAPYAMDSVNADAFDEALKDLINMGAQATRPFGSG